MSYRKVAASDGLGRANSSRRAASRTRAARLRLVEVLESRRLLATGGSLVRAQQLLAWGSTEDLSLTKPASVWISALKRPTANASSGGSILTSPSASWRFQLLTRNPAAIRPSPPVAPTRVIEASEPALPTPQPLPQQLPLARQSSESVLVRGSLSRGDADLYALPMPARTVGLLIDVLMPPPSARSAPGTLQLIDSLGVTIGNFEVDGTEGQVSILAWCPEYAVNTNVYLRIEPAATEPEPEPSDEATDDSAELLDDSTTSATGTDGTTEITEAPTPYEIGITLLFPEEPEIPEPVPLVEISRPDSPAPSVVRSTPSAAVLVLTGLSGTSLTRPTSGGLDLVSSVGHGNSSRTVRQPLSQSLRNPSVVDLTLVEFDSPQTPDAETSPQGGPVPSESSELRTPGDPHRTSDEVRSPGGLPLLAAVLPAPGPVLHQSLNLRFVDLNSPDGAPQPGSPAGVAVAQGEATPDPAATPLPPENSEQTGSRTLSTTLGLSLASLLALGLLWPDFISGIPGRNVLKRGMLARWCRRLLNGSGRGFGPLGSHSIQAD